MHKTERKNIATLIWLIIGISLAIHLLSFIVGKTLLENWRWAHVLYGCIALLLLPEAYSLLLFGFQSAGSISNLFGGL